MPVRLVSVRTRGTDGKLIPVDRINPEIEAVSVMRQQARRGFRSEI
jgi:hypothetical protein